MKLVLLGSGIELTVQDQKVSLLRENGADKFGLTVSVRHDQDWEPLFGQRQPLLSGPSFDLLPSAYEIIEHSAERIAVLLTGTHVGPDYAWDLLVEARKDSPW